MENTESYTKISTAPAGAIEKLYKTGGLALVFIFIGLFLTVFSFIYTENKYPIISDSDIIIDMNGGIYEKYNLASPKLSIDIINKFLQKIQNPLGIPFDDEYEWVELSASRVNEHSHWISRDILEKILGESLNRSSIESKTFEQKTNSEKIREILLCKVDYVAFVDNE